MAVWEKPGDRMLGAFRSHSQVQAGGLYTIGADQYILGTAFVFAFAFGMIWREHVELDRLVQACLDEGTVCWPTPSAFTRFAIYAFIGLFEVFFVFTLSLRVEERIRRRDYAPEWR